MTGHLPRSLWLCLHDYTVFKQPRPLTVTAKRSVLKSNLLAFQRRASLDPLQEGIFAHECLLYYGSGGGAVEVSWTLLLLLLTVVKLQGCRSGCSPGGKRFMKCTSRWLGNVFGPLRGRPFLVKPTYQPT